MAEMTLSQIAGAVKSQPKDTVAVDITPFIEAPSGASIILTWQKPSVASVYRRWMDAEVLKSRNRIWPDALCLDVASMAICHVAPMTGETPIGVFYEEIAQNQENPDLWTFLVSTMYSAFPTLRQDLSNDTLKKILVAGQPVQPSTSPPETDSSPSA